MPQSSFLSPVSQERVQVLAPFPVGRAYDYVLPEGMAAQTGDYVRISLGRKETLAVVWSQSADDTVPLEKLKAIAEKYDFPALPSVHRHFIDWVAKYTMSDLGSVLKMTLSAPDAVVPPKKKRKEQAPPCSAPDLSPSKLVLSEGQAVAAEALREYVAAGKFTAALLDGVTGSGKTEVYFEAVAEALRHGKQALILLPEISLSAQFLERFIRRFGCEPAIWHSEVTPARRRGIWEGVAKGETKVVIGARSALFLPYADLGLIVVDEEHDASYKQEEGVLYNARDMAVVRARFGHFPAVLVSATPSLETMMNAREGRYQYLHLASRHAGAQLPEVRIIDLKVDKPERQRFLAPPLAEALIKNFEAKEQSLLFLNRRGYAPLTLCRTCGHRFQCPSCTSWLVEHKRHKRLQCHHCGFAQGMPKACPSCNDEDSLAACGPGVERIQEEVQLLLPEARTLVLASDIVSHADMVQNVIGSIERQEIDIIIGTQIVAKGHHFPALTLVGVVDADLGLAGGDLRAGERTFQLLHQVSGRAGRGAKTGRVMMQTYMPEQKVIRALAQNNRDHFLAVEGQERQQAGMPPYGRLAALIVAGPDEMKLEHFCRAIAQKAPRYDDIRILGPASAPMAFLRGKHRRRFLIKTGKDINIQKFLQEWLDDLKVPSSMQLKIDIDPQSFF